jgi:cellulose synthase/poly-beta-1,6-N-acetylglucosamine synthase-like glycosyltransferase
LGFDREGEAMHDHFEQQPGYRVPIIIPARNEAPNLPHVLEVLSARLHEVIMVDGHPTDGPIEFALPVWPDAITEIHLVRDSM